MIDPPLTRTDEDRPLDPTLADGRGTVADSVGSPRTSHLDARTLVDDPQATLAAVQPAAPHGRAVPEIAGYEIFGELGRGSMGVVYHARQMGLNRPCALKMILAGAHADEVASRRFRAEAEAVARLQHPNVVQIHHVGEAAGLPYFELEYVVGGSLDRRLDGTPWPPDRAAGLIEAIARGVGEAHRLGIVHRDLKPANVLIADDGTPKVADFGLAKSLAADSGLTGTESVLGSPNYMAPEQAEGRTRHVGPLADVYSLGAILYELLTGRPPFRGATVLDTLEQVKHADPVAPSRLVPGVPRDLETVTLRCLQKEPARRYASAAALVEDLRRFAGGEPILARPTGPAERAWRWCRRKPVVAGLTAAVGVLIVALIGWAFVYAAEQRRLAVEKSALADDRMKFAAEQVKSSLRMRSDLYRTLLGRASVIRRARSPGYRGIVWADLHEAAGLDIPGNDRSEILAELVACLGDPIGLEPVPPYNIRWSWSVPREIPWVLRTRSHVIAQREGLFALAEPASDRNGGVPSVVLATADGQVVRRQKSPATTIQLLKFTPDGSRLVAACVEGVAVWTVPDLEPWATFVGDTVEAVAVHPAGTLMATMTRQARTELWSLATNRLLASFQANVPVKSIDFSDDGRYLLAIPNAGGTARIAWPIRDTAERLALIGHRAGVAAVAFSPGGRAVASTSRDRTVKVWDARTGALIATLGGHEDMVNGLAFSPDGSLLASGDGRGLVLVRAFPSGDVLATVTMPENHLRVVQLAFDPAGRYLAALANDGLAVWAIRRDGGRGELALLASSRVESSIAMALHPGGQVIAVLGWSGAVWSYDLEPGRREMIPASGATPFAGGITFRRAEDAPSPPAQDHFLYITGEGKVGVREWEKGVNLPPLARERRVGGPICLSPDSRWLAVQAESGRIAILDATTGQEVVTLPAEPGAIRCAAWSPAGSRIAVGVADGSLAIWDLDQVRARAAEFGIEMPSTSSRQPGSAPSPAVDNAGAERLLAAVRGRDAAQAALAAQVNQAAIRGDWPHAAEAQEALAAASADHQELYRAVVLRAWAGEREPYRRSCRKFLDRFGDTTDPIVADRLAKACLILPTAGQEAQEGIVLAERALARAGESWLLPSAQLAVGLVECRSRNPEATIRWVDRSLANPDSRPWPVLRANAHFLRAQALARVGRAVEARAAIASGLAEATPPPLEGQPFFDGWTEVAISHMLRREAEIALLDAAFPADPFGRSR